MATSTTITTPKQFVPIGVVQPDGRVLPSPEFVRFLFDIIRRIGGDGSSVSIDGLLASLTQAEAGIDALDLAVQGLQMEPLPVIPEVQGDVSPPVLVLPREQEADGRLSALEAEFAVMRDQINGLLQGATP